MVEFPTDVTSCSHYALVWYSNTWACLTWLQDYSPYSHINDPVNKYVVLDAVTFHFDKEEARKILDRVSILELIQS